MAVRDVLVRFRADVAGFTSPLEKAKASVDAAKASVEGLHKRNAESQAWRQVSTNALAAGAAITAGLGFAVKAALDWESAWAGVTKTVDASPAQFQQLEGELKALARTLPVSATEIAAVAENAGQLGIKAQDIAKFTETMIGLGEATNLTSEEASTGIAQIANIMGTGGDEIERFGSSLVALGNNGASTEADILSMAQRVAASGKLIGLSEQDVLAYSSALTSVGVEAEAGGTALSQTFTQLRDVVDKGGESLEQVAATAGMTGAEFKTAFKTDAAGATEAFITGLQGVEKSGGSASRVLDSLGMSGVRQKNALLSLSGAGDLLANSLQTSNQAWSANSALAAETARRYATTESQMKIAANTAIQAAGEIGAQLLPALAQGAQGVAEFARGFGQLPGPMKAAIGYGGAFAGASLLAVGGTMKLVSGVVELKGNLAALSSAFPRLSAKMAGTNWKGVAVGAGVATVAITAIVAVLNAASRAAEEATLSTESVAEGLNSLGKSGVGVAPLELQIDKLNDGIHKLSMGVNDSNSVVKSAGDLFAKAALASTDFWEGLNLTTDGFLGIRTSTGLIADEIDKLDQGLTDMAASGAEGPASAAKAFGTMAAEAAKSGVSVEQLVPLFDGYSASLQQTAGQLGVTGLSAAELAGWMGGKIPQSVRDAAAAHPELVSALTAAQRASIDEATASRAAADALAAQAEQTRSLAQAEISASGSEVAWKQTLVDTKNALDDVKRSTNKAGTEINLNSKAGRNNQTVLNNLANSALSTAAAMEKTGEGAAGANRVIKQSREAFVSAATKMGLTRQAARELADSYGLIPKKKDTKVEAKGADQAKAKAKSVERAVDSIPKKKTTNIRESGGRETTARAKTVESAVDSIPNKSKTTISEAGGKGTKTSADRVKSAVKAIPGKAKVSISQSGASGAVSWIDKVKAAARALDGTVARVTVKQSTKKAGGGWVGGTPPARRAFGGWVVGPGTQTSDDIHTMLSRDEYVIRAARAVEIERKYPGYLAMLNGHGALPLPGRAAGGGVSTATVATFAAPPIIAGSPTPIVVEPSAPSVSIGNLSVTPQSKDEMRALNQFLAMVGRKVAVRT